MRLDCSSRFARHATILLALSFVGCFNGPGSYSSLAEAPYDINSLEGKNFGTIRNDPAMLATVRQAQQDDRRVFVKTWREPRGVAAAAEGITQNGAYQGVKSGFPHADVVELGVSEDGRSLQFIGQAGQNYGAYTSEKNPVPRDAAAGVLNEDADVNVWKATDAVAVPAEAGEKFDSYLAERDLQPGTCEYSVLTNSCITNANSNFTELRRLTDSVEPGNASGFNQATSSAAPSAQSPSASEDKAIASDSYEDLGSEYDLK